MAQKSPKCASTASAKESKACKPVTNTGWFTKEPHPKLSQSEYGQMFVKQVGKNRATRKATKTTIDGITIFNIPPHPPEMRHRCWLFIFPDGTQMIAFKPMIGRSVKAWPKRQWELIKRAKPMRLDTLLGNPKRNRSRKAIHTTKLKTASKRSPLTRYTEKRLPVKLGHWIV